MNYSRVFALLISASSAAFAGEADVVSVDVVCNKAMVCNFNVTVAHDDEGWDHYANSWEVLSPDGEVLGTRELLHPHENEQPFTRSLTNVQIPSGLTEVIVRAHDSVHAFGGAEMTVQLPRQNQ